MERVTLFNFLFSMVPRSIVAIYFCQSILQINLNRKDFIFTSLLFSIIQWTTRTYLPMGYHSFVSCVLLTLILYYYAKTYIATTFSVALIYFTLLYIFDFFVIYIYHLYTNFSLSDIWALELVRVILTLPASIIFIIISLLLKHKKKVFSSQFNLE